MTVRLGQKDVDLIARCLAEKFGVVEGELFLFGSRTKQDLRGGDIDLLLCVSSSTAAALDKKKISIKNELAIALGDRKIDLVVSAKEKPSVFVQEILPTAVLINRFEKRTLDINSILWVRKSKSRKKDFILFKDHVEMPWRKFVSLVRDRVFPGLSVVNTKTGPSVRGNRNSTLTDNLENRTVRCSDFDVLQFDFKHLKLVSRQGHVRRSWPAVSGVNGSLPADQKREDFGPLPEGRYTVFFSETSDYEKEKRLWQKAYWYIRYPSWGWVATPIRPQRGTTTYGRGRFFVHGGLFPGSLGCIDLLDGNEDFHAYMRMYKRDFSLVVNYLK